MVTECNQSWTTEREKKKQITVVDGIAPKAAYSFLLLQLVFPLPRGLQGEQNSYLPGALDTQM